MANKDVAIFGLRPVKMIGGAPWTELKVDIELLQLWNKYLSR